MDPATEWNRIGPVIHGLLDASPDALISVDTFHAEVAAKALEAGAFMINDIYAGSRSQEMTGVIRATGAPYAIMHMQGTPATMQLNPSYDDPIRDISHWFSERISSLENAGIHQLILDVGFGFGKSIADNFALLNGLDAFANFELPLLVGVSRKSMIWKTLNIRPEESLNGTSALHAWALDRGAHLLRVHDATEAREVVALHERLSGKVSG